MNGTPTRMRGSSGQHLRTRKNLPRGVATETLAGDSHMCDHALALREEVRGEHVHHKRHIAGRAAVHAVHINSMRAVALLPRLLALWVSLALAMVPLIKQGIDDIASTRALQAAGLLSVSIQLAHKIILAARRSGTAVHMDDKAHLGDHAALGRCQLIEAVDVHGETGYINRVLACLSATVLLGRLGDVSGDRGSAVGPRHKVLECRERTCARRCANASNCTSRTYSSSSSSVPRVSRVRTQGRVYMRLYVLCVVRAFLEQLGEHGEVGTHVHFICMKRAHAAGHAGPAKRTRPTLAVAPAAPIPPSISLDYAVAGRRAEILALHRAMKSAREAGNTRAWQLLPRHLRRRAASHNLLRLPAYLRGKARAELRASNTVAKTRGELRRRMPERTVGGFVRRREQLARRAGRRSKRWLETHLWHAKRFRMTADKRRADGGDGHWGFCLAETPHLKSHRASWRAANKSATVHDASYTSVFSVHAKGSKPWPLQLFLYLAGAVHGWEDEWTSGERICRTVLLGGPDGRQVLGAVAPIAVLWLPGNELRIFVHPAGARDVRAALDRAAAALRKPPPAPDLPSNLTVNGSLKREHVSVRRIAMAPPESIAAGLTGTAQRQSKQHHVVAGVAPALRLEGFNVFDMIGPDAGRILGGVLRNAGGVNASLFRRLIHQEAPLSSADIPAGLVVSAEVDDPRVSFPPKNIGIAEYTRDTMPRPTPERTFFDYARLPTYSQGEITRQTEPAERVPVVLIQNTVGKLHGYTLLVPRGWGQAFWLSLVHTGAKVLGLAQVRQQCLNAQIAAFPYDWVGTRAQVDYDKHAAAERCAAWSRRPPAKRVNYASLGREHPFGGPELWREIGMPHLAYPSDSLVTARGPQAPLVPSLWSRSQYSDGVYTQPDDCGDALVPVLLCASRKGAFGECATVHLPAEQDVPTWRAALNPPTREKAAAAARLQQLENSGAVGPQIGAVSTGDYALQSGSGRAHACIRLDAWRILAERERGYANGARQWGRLKRNRVPLERLVLVRNADSHVLRAASASLAQL